MNLRRTDLLLTWPKSSPLRSYLSELRRALERGDVINYRVAAEPLVADCQRVYMVYDGKIRGWSPFIDITWRGAGVVRDRGGGYWPEGWYIVRSPEWVDLDPAEQTPMRGFQGFRYFNERN